MDLCLPAPSRLALALALTVPAAARGTFDPTPAAIPGAVRDAAIAANLKSLKRVPVPRPAELGLYVKDRAALLVLGKALFWDRQVGSDGQACASCHFHAGADNRSKNQLNPGTNVGDTTFGGPAPLASHGAFGPNYQLTAADFPLHRLADPQDRRSAVLADTNDRVASQGVFDGRFTATGIPYDVGDPDGGAFRDIFHVNGVRVRNVEPRNTPTVVNAALNARNFWDGRARSEFNGVDPLGRLDPNALVVRVFAGRARLVRVNVETNAVASQADGPVLSDLEMSFAGRTFPDVGRKLLDLQLTPLGGQLVAPDDSLLGPYSRQAAVGPGAPGLTVKYAELVRQAFQPEWWDATGWRAQLVRGRPVVAAATAAPPGAFTVMEANFGLYFGIAVAEYERMLVSDDAPLDRFLEGDNAALSSDQLAGFAIFLGKGGCVGCHGGAELTNASISSSIVLPEGVTDPGDKINAPGVRRKIVERMITADGRVSAYDNGFYNIGVRPTAEDRGLENALGPLGLPLSEARRFQACVKRLFAATKDVRVANRLCGVPRIPAVPVEARELLGRAASLLGNPAEVMALFALADPALQEPNPVIAAAVPPLVSAARALARLGAGNAAVKDLLAQATLLLPDPLDPGTDAANPLGPPLGPDERVMADGAFKTPSLRNVELTAPYFHNGGQATLLQVVEFYDRGGDFRDQNGADVDRAVRPLGLTSPERDQVAAFMLALTDERVRWDRAPFDHPSLDVPNGGDPASPVLLPALGIQVLDDRVTLPAVGSGGSSVPLGTPRTPFANFLDPLR
jgi:cytochrome c peroxidase